MLLNTIYSLRGGSRVNLKSDEVQQEVYKLSENPLTTNNNLLGFVVFSWDESTTKPQTNNLEINF